MATKHPACTLGPKQLDALKKAASSPHRIHREGLAALLRSAPLTYKPRPLETVDIGPYGKGRGHEEFTGDCTQAYLQALAYIATANPSHSRKSKEIILSWARTCKVFRGDNAPLECAWGAPCLVRAVELLRYAPQPMWTPEDAAYFDAFLDRIVMPNLLTRYAEVRRWRNNWAFSILEALIQVALYRDDLARARALADDFRALLRECVQPCGCNTENARDMVHCQFQVASQVQIAEMLHHQGIDAYDPLIATTMEYQARILQGHCPPELTPAQIKDNWMMPGAWEAGYNHYKNRKNNPMPHTTALLNLPKSRPERQSFNWGPGWVHYLTY